MFTRTPMHHLRFPSMEHQTLMVARTPKPKHLTLPQLLVWLQKHRAHSEFSTRNVANALSLPMGDQQRVAVSHKLTKLCQMGLVVSVTPAKKKFVQYRLTDKGRAVTPLSNRYIHIREHNYSNGKSTEHSTPVKSSPLTITMRAPELDAKIAEVEKRISRIDNVLQQFATAWGLQIGE